MRLVLKVDPDQFPAELKSISRELRTESDRGSVLVGAALLDEALEQLLKKRLISPAQRKDRLFDGAYSPLQNLSAKADLAYRLGLISSHELKCIHIVRSLRNDFAHYVQVRDFGEQSVKDRVGDLLDLNCGLFDGLHKVASKMPAEDAERLAPLRLEGGTTSMMQSLGPRVCFEFIVSLFVYLLRHTTDAVPKIRPLVGS